MIVLHHNHTMSTGDQKRPDESSDRCAAILPGLVRYGCGVMLLDATVQVYPRVSEEVIGRGTLELEGGLFALLTCCGVSARQYDGGCGFEFVVGG